MSDFGLTDDLGDDPGVVALPRPPAPAEGAAAPAAAPATTPTPAMTAEQLPMLLESLLLASDRPLEARDLAALVGEPGVELIEAALAELEQHYQGRGIQLHSVAGGWQFRTHPDSAPWVARLLAQRPIRLSRAQLETLAIVAYRQPVTRPEIDDIRGVDSGATLKLLLDRSLVRILGKKEEPGRPLLYGTTREFLEFFNLADLRGLPTLREFRELTDEHQAQVDAVAGPRPAGPDPAAGMRSVPVAPLAPPPVILAPLQDDDLEGVERMIEEAGRTAQAAARAVAHETDPPPEASNEPASGPTPEPTPEPVAEPPDEQTEEL